MLRFFLICCCLPLLAQAQSVQPADLVGLWSAKIRLGPDARGTFRLERSGSVWRASIAGRVATAQLRGDTIQAGLAGGEFVGRFQRDRSVVVGDWTYVPTRMQSPVRLTSCGPDCYRGEAVLPDESYTYYLKVVRQPDGSLGAFLRNPERNLGGPWIPVRAVRPTGSTVALLDRNGRTIAAGTLRDDVLTIPLRGGSADFTRVADTAYTDFYPRGHPTARYTYSPPAARSDGWPVDRLRNVGIAEDSIASALQWLINLSIDSLNTPQTHAVLMARHGKLVLEEYFFGEHADKPHDTRSGAKTYLTALVGAAMQAGVRMSPETRLYETLRPGARNLPADKRAVNLDHLLTMSAGFDCDDSGDRPGDEARIQDGDVPDWTRVFLDVDVVRPNGTQAVYCSMKPHVAGLMLARVAGRSLSDLFRDLIASPLQMQQYHLFVTPVGEVYSGGGHQVIARDYLKLAQLYLDRGTWRGRRILSQDWVDQSIKPRFKLGSRMYGYLIWMQDYPYRGATVRNYCALGNGSQNACWIPELDLAITLFGANYNSPTINYLLNEFIPKRILPAVEPGK